MTTVYNGAGTTFLEDVISERQILEHVAKLAQGHPYIGTRFLFHHHLYETKVAEPIRIAEDYAAHLGYSPESREQPPSASPLRANLCEIPVDLAHSIVCEAFRWDVARGEELVIERDADVFMDKVREATEAWAMFAFTNLELPSVRKSSLLSYPFHRIVTRSEVECGVIFVGELDVAMIWFVDDDDLTRGIEDRRMRMRD